MTRIMGVAAAAALALGVPAFAADKDGRFAIKGAGIGSCADYAAAFREGEDGVLVYASWVNGYVSALNQSLPATFDLAAWQSIDFMMAYLAESCEQAPEAQFYVAAGQLMTRLRGERLAVASDIVEINGRGETAAIYESMIAKIKGRLSDLGYFSGEARTNEFGSDARAALVSFQESQDLPATGAPNQDTLFRLLYWTRVEESGVAIQGDDGAQ